MRKQGVKYHTKGLDRVAIIGDLVHNVKKVGFNPLGRVDH